jgi:hypothetical protein
MKKALHNEPDVFLSSEDGRISAWGSGAESALVAIANQGLKYDFEETTLALPEPMLLERAAAIWLIRLLEEGVTGRLIDEVNRWTSKIRYRRLLVMIEGEPPQWQIRLIARNVVVTERGVNEKGSLTARVEYCLMLAGCC